VDDVWWTLSEPKRRTLHRGHRRWTHWRRRRGDALWAATDPLRQSWRHASLRRRALVVVLAILPFAMASAACAVVVASIR
jgi:hypothetical protein